MIQITLLACLSPVVVTQPPPEPATPIRSVHELFWRWTCQPETSNDSDKPATPSQSALTNLQDACRVEHVAPNPDRTWRVYPHFVDVTRPIPEWSFGPDKTADEREAVFTFWISMFR